MGFWQGDDFDERHFVRGIEEVQADDAFRVRHAGGEAATERAEVLVARMVSGPVRAARSAKIFFFRSRFSVAASMTR
jgi:hypothetical protein